MDPLADIGTFLEVFGRPVSSAAFPAVVGKRGILDMNGAVLADGTVLSTDYALTVENSPWGALKYADPIVHDGVSYTVREARPIDDGVFCIILVSKV